MAIVQLTQEPPTAQLRIEETPTAISKEGRLLLNLGDYKLQVHAPDYLPVTKRITVLGGETLALSSLQPSAIAVIREISENFLMAFSFRCSRLHLDARRRALRWIGASPWGARAFRAGTALVCACLVLLRRALVRVTRSS